MSESSLRRTPGTRFSLRHLLTITALIAVGIAVWLAFQLNRSLTQQRDELLALSSRLPLNSEAELVSVALPSVANNFYSWNVQVPKAQDLELRLGIGDVSQKGIPPIVGSVRVTAGQHRVTLYTGDSKSEEFRFTVFLDGKPVIEKTMGSSWLPNGWSSSSSINWPTSPILSPPPFQLAAKSYAPKEDFGKQYYFNRQSDNSITCSGFRLWIDRPDRTYQPASPFIGFPGENLGIGLRDGLRYGMSTVSAQWTFTRPTLATIAPVLRVDAEFVTTDGTVLSSQSQAFKSWQICNSSTEVAPLRWQEGPALTSQTVFLHAVSKSTDGPRPVVELKWDVSQPDAVGMRLADTPANDQVSRWRIRILDGCQHLWRELQVGDQPWLTPAEALTAGNVQDASAPKSPKRTAVLTLGAIAAKDIQLQWQTNETLPLQIVERKDNRFAGLELYQGLPVRMGIQLSSASSPQLTVDVVDSNPNVPGTPLPGGPAFDAIQIEFDATVRDWIWMSAKPKQ